MLSQCSPHKNLGEGGREGGQFHWSAGVCNDLAVSSCSKPILLCAARTEVWNVVLMTQENSFKFQQAGHCSSAKGNYSIKKAAQPGKFLHVLLYSRWLVAKHLVATSNATIASQKVVSKHIARIHVQETIAIYAVNMCTRKHPNKLNPVQQLLHSKMWFETIYFLCGFQNHYM